ncbi:MAG: ammonium transporter [Geminicoccaceae bacterium]
MRVARIPAWAGLALGLLPGLALAQDQAPTIDTGDTAWMLVSTALVLLMTIPGVALFYGGMVRKINVLAAVMQSFTICCLVAVVWMVIGYSLAFGNGGAYLGDLSRVFLSGMPLDSTPFLMGPEGDSVLFTIPESVWVMFQMTFAIITPALITGAIADRMKFSALIIFVVIWSIVVYAPVAHWVWHPSGFAWDWGILDFAGGTVVHINAGIAGLVAALVLGRRRGYPTEPMMPHNLVLNVTGASLLWVGWFGFNAGSAAAANGRAGLAMLVTMIATAVAGLAWMFSEWSSRGKPSVLGITSGAVAGLVAITPAAGFVSPVGALFIGLASGIICFISVTVVKVRLGYDDSLDCFGVHGVGGIVGAILTGVFATEAASGVAGLNGLLYGNPGQLWLQIQGVLITVIYSGVLSYVILKIIDVLIGLRVTKDEEREGLDLALHGEAVH